MQEMTCEITSGKVGENQDGGFLGKKMQSAYILFVISNEKISVFNGILEFLMNFVNLV